MWTKFWDMHSGGDLKEDFHCLYIEAPEEEAKIILYNRFGHNPERVSCTCCGRDYSIRSEKSLAQITAYHRNCDYDRKTNLYVEKPNMWSEKVTPLEEYLTQEGVAVIYATEIADAERR